jgi:putative tricarboxylic transport membrane protein
LQVSDVVGLEHLALGFATALTPPNLLACLAGAVLGTAIGVLPGLGPLTTIALLLPFTFSLSPTAAVIMLAGIYYGAQYGGSVTAVLANLPGEASSAITCLDGYAMARDGRAGLALAVAAIGSFVGGTVGTLLIAVLAVPLASVAARFEAADYTALMMCGLVAAIVIAHGSVLKAVVMAVAGLLLGAVGTDVVTGQARFTMGVPELFDGIGFMPLAIGLFGLAEVIGTLASPGERTLMSPRIHGVWADRGETRRAAASTFRGTAIGSLLGILPGGGPLIASFASYAIEKRFASGPPPLGSGAIEGIAGPESANNAAAQTSFVPLLTLGLPANAVMALLLGALVVHGIQPGPAIIAKEPTLFWGLVASMWIGNAMLLVLNLPLVGLWARLLRVPYRLLYPTTVVVSCTGIYAVNHSPVDLWMTASFGVAGYLLRGRGFEPAPLLLGFVLSRPLEENLRRALVFSNGDLSTFVTHPMSAFLLAVASGSLLVASVPAVRRRRELLR